MNDDPKALLQRYQPKEGKILKTDRQLTLLRYSPCGKILAAGGTDGTVRRWDAAAAEMTELPRLTGHGGFVQGLVFHPDGQRLFTADSWGRLSCWPYAEREPKPLWTIEQAHDGWIRGLALSADGKCLATCGLDQKVRVWSVEGTKKQELTGHNEDVYSVAFHPDGKSLVSGDLKGFVRVWDLEAGKTARQLDASVLYILSRLQDVGGLRCLVFDAKGETLAVAGTQPKGGASLQGTPTVLLYDWQSGKLQHTVTVGAVNDGFVHDLHFHPAGFLMAVTSGLPGSGKFFFLRPGDAQPFFLSAKMPNCHSLALHPNGQRLAVAATNGGSNGNGRLVGKDKEYPGNFSPVHLFDLPTSG